MLARSVRKNASFTEKANLEDRRNRLQSRIDAFHRKMESSLGEDVDESNLMNCDSDDDDWIMDTDMESEAEEEDDEVVEWPENCRLRMPSTLGVDECARLGLGKLAEQEVELRTGQANDCLENLRLTLGEKMVIFRTSVRGANSQRKTTRAWDDVHLIEQKANKHSTSYRQARRALVNLGADAKILDRFKVLKQEDVKMSGDMLEENRVGQRSDKLPWIWRMKEGNLMGNNDWMQEGKCLSSLKFGSFHSSTVYRVKWLRGKARYDRWQEELTTVKSEMENTIRWFQHQKLQWEVRRGKVDVALQGHVCYAEKQVVMWARMIAQAQIAFMDKMK
jgi:hypothetical protein